MTKDNINQQTLQRGLKNRHIQLIAIGGAIGTGLFLGSGKSIHFAGPCTRLPRRYGSIYHRLDILVLLDFHCDG